MAEILYNEFDELDFDGALRHARPERAPVRAGRKRCIICGRKSREGDPVVLDPDTGDPVHGSCY